MNPGASRNPFVRWPLPALLVCLLLSLPGLQVLRRVTVVSDARTLLEGDQRNLAAYEKVRAILNDDVVLVISMAGTNLFSQKGFADLREFCGELKEMRGLRELKSLTHSVKPVRRGFQFAFEPFVPRGELSADQIEEIRRYSITHPLVRNIMVAPDARHTIITCNFRRDLGTAELQRAFRDEMEAVLEPYRARGYRLTTIALPLVALEMGETVTRDVKEFAAWLGVVVFVLLWLALRSVSLTLICLLNLAATMALLPGLMHFLGVSLTFYSMMLFPLVAGVQLTLSAHLYMGAAAAWRRGVRGREAVNQALARVLKSCAFGALTTIVGLLSLAFCEVRQVSVFGLAGAAGVALAFAWTFAPGSALLCLGAATIRDPSGLPPAPDFSRWCGWVDRHRNRIVWLGVAGLAVAALGLTRVRTDIRVAEFLDQDSATRQALREFDEVYGGINVVQFKIDSGNANGVNLLPFLSYVESVQAFADADPRVSATYSYAQLMAMMNQIWEQEKEGSLALPRNPLTLGMFALALKSQQFPFLATLTDKNFRTATVIVRTRDMRSTEYLDLLRGIVEHAEASRPEGVTVSAKQGIHSILEADRKIMDAQLGSVGLTVGVVGLTLALLWRSVWLAGVALLVNVIPVGLAVAWAGFAGLPLNSVTVMVAAIALSVAVDDSVHFITWWRDERSRGSDPLAALGSAFRIKGPPVLGTSLILAAVFGLFQVFSFPPVRHFGALSSAAFIGALLASLALLPALLPRRKGEVGKRQLSEPETRTTR